jgi:hypothetical protein
MKPELTDVPTLPQQVWVFGPKVMLNKNAVRVRGRIQADALIDRLRPLFAQL